MKKTWTAMSITVGAVVGLSTVASAVNVLVISSDRQEIDTAVLAALKAGGHAATLGPNYTNFTEDFDLSPYDVVYLQSNANYSNPDMSVGGQQALLEFVEAGGGLVTCEWAEWKSYAQDHFRQLRVALPGIYLSYDGSPSATYTESETDAVLNKGLPGSFDFGLDSYGGTESYLSPKCSAVEYYHAATGSGVLGWNYRIGRVLSFSTTNGSTQLADPEFALLFSNAMTWASLAGGDPHAGYTSDCDASGKLDLFDFLCFTNAFNAQQPYADCDGDNAFTLFDFLCFVNTFNSEC